MTDQFPVVPRETTHLSSRFGCGLDHRLDVAIKTTDGEIALSRLIRPRAADTNERKTTETSEGFAKAVARTMNDAMTRGQTNEPILGDSTVIIRAMDHVTLRLHTVDTTSRLISLRLVCTPVRVPPKLHRCYRLSG